jgi:hypothetical protein
MVFFLRKVVWIDPANAQASAMIVFSCVAAKSFSWHWEQNGAHDAFDNASFR